MPAQISNSRGDGRRDSRYVDAHPKGQFGRHAYKLDELGLDGDAIADRYSDYIKRHDIAREAL